MKLSDLAFADEQLTEKASHVDGRRHSTFDVIRRWTAILAARRAAFDLITVFSPRVMLELRIYLAHKSEVVPKHSEAYLAKKEDPLYSMHGIHPPWLVYTALERHSRLLVENICLAP